MTEKKHDGTILYLTVPLSILTALVSYAGIFTASTYSTETIGYAAQGIGQDIVNLFLVVPILLITGFFAWRKSKINQRIKRQPQDHTVSNKQGIEMQTETVDSIRIG